MTKTNMDSPELLAKHDQGDVLRGIAEAVLQLIMEADVETCADQVRLVLALQGRVPDPQPRKRRA